MRLKRLCRIFVIGLAACLAGCTTTPQRFWDSLKGEGFSGWSDSIASGVRGDAKAAKPSGFFTDRRSEQIEKDLGGF